jgi:hypothetical protein
MSAVSLTGRDRAEWESDIYLVMCVEWVDPLRGRPVFCGVFTSFIRSFVIVAILYYNYSGHVIRCDCVTRRQFGSCILLGSLLPYYPYWATKCISATNLRRDFWPDWDAVPFRYLSVFHVIPCQFLLPPIILSTYQAFIVTMYVFQCKYKC